MTNDPMGVKMIYPSASNAKAVYLSIPTVDQPAGTIEVDEGINTGRVDLGGHVSSVFWNVDNDGQLFDETYYTSNGNDSYRLSIVQPNGYNQSLCRSQITHENTLASRGYMQDSNDYKNVEITGYIKLISSSVSDDQITFYCRGGHHTGTNDCEGTSYKGDIRFNDGAFRLAKEQYHVHYVFRNFVSGGGSIVGKWVGFKMITFDVSNGVKTELWVDRPVPDNATAAPNNWALGFSYIDSGGWGDDAGHCGASNDDQILTWGGPLAAFRWDNVNSIRWKFFSVREINASGGTTPPDPGPQPGGGGAPGHCTQ